MGRKFAGNASQRFQVQREKQNRDIFKILITLVLTFYVCSLRILTLNMSFALGFYAKLLKINLFRFIPFFQYFLDGAINPIIYNIFNENILEGFKVALPNDCACF